MESPPHFPRLFFIDGNKLEYYEGPHEEKEMLQWYSSKIKKGNRKTQQKRKQKRKRTLKQKYIGL
jgi:type VI protein secretion system component VasK